MSEISRNPTVISLSITLYYYYMITLPFVYYYLMSLCNPLLIVLYNSKPSYQCYHRVKPIGSVASSSAILVCQRASTSGSVSTDKKLDLEWSPSSSSFIKLCSLPHYLLRPSTFQRRFFLYVKLSSLTFMIDS